LKQVLKYSLPLLGVILLLGCGGENTETAPEKDQRSRPVEMLLIDGRPDPSILAEEQILRRDNGEEPQTLDPHLAEGVPSSHILRDLALEHQP
jgi:oligopeptide transport system substrate-binding protein